MSEAIYGDSLFPLVLASLLDDDGHAQLRQHLDSIASVTTIVVNLEYKDEVLPPTYRSVCANSNLYDIVKYFEVFNEVMLNLKGDHNECKQIPVHLFNSLFGICLTAPVDHRVCKHTAMADVPN